MSERPFLINQIFLWLLQRIWICGHSVRPCRKPWTVRSLVWQTLHLTKGAISFTCTTSALGWYLVMTDRSFSVSLAPCWYTKGNCSSHKTACHTSYSLLLQTQNHCKALVLNKMFMIHYGIHPALYIQVFHTVNFHHLTNANHMLRDFAVSSSKIVQWPLVRVVALSSRCGSVMTEITKISSSYFAYFWLHVHTYFCTSAFCSAIFIEQFLSLSGAKYFCMLYYCSIY